MSSKIQLTVRDSGPEASIKWFGLECAPTERRLIFVRVLKMVVELLAI